MAENLKKIILYTDGACSGNPGPGGWGAVLSYKNAKKQISGFDPDTTNNRMELTAVIKGLMCLKERCLVEVYTDSAYVLNAFQKGWIVSWQNNGWKTANKRDRSTGLCTSDPIVSHFMSKNSENAIPIMVLLRASARRVAAAGTAHLRGTAAGCAAIFAAVICIAGCRAAGTLLCGRRTRLTRAAACRG